MRQEGLKRLEGVSSRIDEGTATNLLEKLEIDGHFLLPRARRRHDLLSELHQSRESPTSVGAERIAFKEKGSRREHLAAFVRQDLPVKKVQKTVGIATSK